MVLYPGMTQEAMDASGVSSVLAAPAISIASCRELGCVHMHGQFKCEFCPRKGTDDKKSRAGVTIGRRNRVPARWKEYCCGDRVCCWQINYTFNIKIDTYVLSPKCVEHKGHRMDVPSSTVTHILTASDVTADMWDQLCQWVAIPLGGHKLRKVSAHIGSMWCTSGVILVYVWFMYGVQIVSQWFICVPNLTESIVVCSRVVCVRCSMSSILA